MPPTSTTTAETTTPKRRRLPMTTSMRLSVQLRSPAISNPPRKPLVEHLDSQKRNHQAKDAAQPCRVRFHEDPSAQQRSGKNTQHYRHGEPRVNISTSQINPGAGGGCDANHEVAGSG